MKVKQMHTVDLIGTKYLSCKGFRSVPIVGTTANNVRPIDRKAVTPKKGTLAPILKWANSVGNNWVNETVRSYQKGVK